MLIQKKVATLQIAEIRYVKPLRDIVDIALATFGIWTHDKDGK